jgi:hypothetical protein
VLNPVRSASGFSAKDALPLRRTAALSLQAARERTCFKKSSSQKLNLNQYISYGPKLA